MGMSEETSITDTREITKNLIIGKLLEGKSKAETARILGISRQTIYNYLNDTNAMQIINAELEGLKSQHIDTINEWITSDDNALKRAALQERGKLVLKLEDKTKPSLKQSLNVTLNVDVDAMQQREKLWTESISMLPPTCREQFFHNVDELKNKWGWKTES